MKTTKHKGITYQLDESKFKPAYIYFDQDMFDDEIYPVLVGFGFEVQNLEPRVRYLLTNFFALNPFKFSKCFHPCRRTQCHTATEFLEASGIFAVVDELPKDWYIEVTDDNLEELDAWRKKVASYYKNATLKSGWFVLSKHYIDTSHVWAFNGICSEKELLKKHPNHKKIDLETFRKITGSAPKQKMNYKITAEQAQSIINIACENWKKKLAEKWANNIVLNKEIEISEEFYKEMRKACTEPQNKLFDKIFGEDGSVDLSEIYGLKLLVMSDNTLSIRDSGEYYNTAFYLTDNFNWELKRDSQEKLCLIPTKKNRGCHN